MNFPFLSVLLPNLSYLEEDSLFVIMLIFLSRGQEDYLIIIQTALRRLKELNQCY